HSIGDGDDRLAFLIGQVAPSVLLQHAVQDGMCACGMCGLIGVQCRERSVLDFRDGLQADGLLCSALMFEEVVHVGLHVGEIAEHLRRRDDAWNGDPLMALYVAIHTGEIEERCAETSDEQDEDKAERKREFLADGEAGNPADGRATHSQRYHSTVATARGSVATDGLAQDRFAALVPVPVEGDVRVDDVDRVLSCDGEEYACRVRFSSFVKRRSSLAESSKRFTSSAILNALPL